MTALSLEHVRCETQAMENPVGGVAYRQPERRGYEAREYMPEWGCRCACRPLAGAALQIGHIRPHSRGGSDRVANLTLACESCSRKKGSSLGPVPGRDVPVRQIGCACRGPCQRTCLTAHGFPRGNLMRARHVRGVQPADIARAIVPGGKKAGTGRFNVRTTGGVVRGTGWLYCRVPPHATGYSYATRGNNGSASSPRLKAGVCAVRAR